MSVQSEPAFAIAPLDDAHVRAVPIFRRPGVAPECEHDFTNATRGLHARAALAEMALTLLQGENLNLVVPARRLMRRPPNALVLVDAYVSCFLFAAWSTIETCVFAANALGHAIDPVGFRALADAKALRDVSPDDVIVTSKKYRPAYARVLPEFHAAMNARWAVLAQLRVQHNVSKHRSGIAVGARGPASVAGIPPQLIQATLEQSVWIDILLDSEPDQPTMATRSIPDGVRFDVVVEEWWRTLNGLAGGLRSDIDVLLTSP